MDQKFLLDRYVGSLLGMAAGDAYGMPANNHSPYSVNCLFQYIDSFYPCNKTGRKAGSYSGVTQLALLEALSLIENKDINVENSIKILKDIKSQGKAKWSSEDKLLRCVPLGLMAAANPVSDSELWKRCGKTWSIFKSSSKTDILASFCITWSIKELIRNNKNLSNIDELCFTDMSMMSRLVELCKKIEQTFDDGPDKLIILYEINNGVFNAHALIIHDK